MLKIITMANDEVPKSLRVWFKIHFIIDLIFGVPLMLIPEIFLGDLGWSRIDPITARLVGAALIGIGGVSLLENNASKESYHSLLTLKLIWSLAAILALVLSILKGAPFMVWILLGVFVLFFLLWGYYMRVLLKGK